jgi:hypothetical protein
MIIWSIVSSVTAKHRLRSSSIRFWRDLSCALVRDESIGPPKKSGVDELSQLGARWFGYRG